MLVVQVDATQQITSYMKIDDDNTFSTTFGYLPLIHIEYQKNPTQEELPTCHIFATISQYLNISLTYLNSQQGFFSRYCVEETKTHQGNLSKIFTQNYGSIYICDFIDQKLRINQFGCVVKASNKSSRLLARFPNQSNMYTNMNKVQRDIFMHVKNNCTMLQCKKRMFNYLKSLHIFLTASHFYTLMLAQCVKCTYINPIEKKSC
eukprot:TRINITY_DN696_c0_g1_i7.p6 TRINITY_DN696_c0_g1~~TRINITY_DN696_c0_g1_i7.p6  ORF type:complete len:205 (+),score=-1.55 TRINITY_DN696_c0_g1_i7:1443-2057(+)